MSTFNEAPNDIREQIEEISEQWAQLKALPEMKFTLGGVEELHDPRVRILYAIDAEGTVLGVTSWLPTWRDGRIIGWTLDFMRHRTDSPNGIMEFLIARMTERLRDEGLEHPECAVEFMSLSAAPLAGMNPQRDNADETGHLLSRSGRAGPNRTGGRPRLRAVPDGEGGHGHAAHTAAVAGHPALHGFRTIAVTRLCTRQGCHA